jgi:hypothetical protein
MSEERINLRDIRKNEKFYWCEYGLCVAFRALTNPIANENGYMMRVAQEGPGRKLLFRHLFEVFEHETRPDYPGGYALRVFRQMPPKYQQL